MSNRSTERHTYILRLTKKALHLSLAEWDRRLERESETAAEYVRAMLVGQVEFGDSEQHTENEAAVRVIRSRFASLVSVTTIPYDDSPPF